MISFVIEVGCTRITDRFSQIGNRSFKCDRVSSRIVPALHLDSKYISFLNRHAPIKVHSMKSAVRNCTLCTCRNGSADRIGRIGNISNERYLILIGILGVEADGVDGDIMIGLENIYAVSQVCGTKNLAAESCTGMREHLGIARLSELRLLHTICDRVIHGRIFV